jgi:hypothetical protein
MELCCDGVQCTLALLRATSVFLAVSPAQLALLAVSSMIGRQRLAGGDDARLGPPV